MEEIHPIRKQELDHQKMRLAYKESFTIIAKFDGIKPCGRCRDPYCLNNLPSYERWDLLKPVLEKLSDLHSTKYRNWVFWLKEFNAGTKIQDAIEMAVSAITFMNLNEAG
jgi:hypothetical protein